MKLISTSLGRVLVSIAVAVIILTCFSSSLLPTVADFVDMVFPIEKNYESPPAVAFDTLLDYKSKNNYRKNVCELVIDLPDNEDDNFNPDEDIFDNYIVSDSVEQTLLDELKADYQKEPYTTRTKVFVYKIDSQGFSLLVDKIDPTVSGEWAVIYVLDDGEQRAALKVDYVFKN